MNTGRTALAAVSLLGGLALASPARAEGAAAPGATERYDLVGNQVSVFNLAGDVTIEPGSGPYTVIEVTREGADSAKLRVKTDLDDDRVDLRVVFPGRRLVQPSIPTETTAVYVDSDGRFGAGFDGEKATFTPTGPGMDARANLRILAPPKVDLSIRLGAGELHVQGVSNSVHIEAFNGAVRATATEGPLVIRTASASIDVDGVGGKKLDAESKSGDIRLAGVRSARQTARSETGKIVVALPHDIGAQLDIRTARGRIASQLPIPLSDSQRRMRGVVGAGGVKLAVESAAGEIDVSGA